MDAIDKTSKKSNINGRFQELSQEEKVHFKVRMKIRTALSNVEDDQKLPTLIAALEEEMHQIWGRTESIEIIITPRPSMLSINGQKRKE